MVTIAVIVVILLLKSSDGLKLPFAREEVMVSCISGCKTRYRAILFCEGLVEPMKSCEQLLKKPFLAVL